MADRLGDNLYTQSWGAMTASESVAKPHRYAFVKEKNPPVPHIFPFLTWNWALL